MPKYKRHTRPEEKRFVKEFVKTGNGKQSALEAFNVKPGSAGQVAYQKLKQSHIQEMIKQAMEDEKLDPKWVIKQRKKIIVDGMNGLDSVKILPSDIEKNLSGLERLMGMNGEKGSGNGSGAKHLHLHQAPRGEVLAKRKEINAFFSEIEQD